MLLFDLFIYLSIFKAWQPWHIGAWGLLTALAAASCQQLGMCEITFNNKKVSPMHAQSGEKNRAQKICTRKKNSVISEIWVRKEREEVDASGMS